MMKKTIVTLLMGIVFLNAGGDISPVKTSACGLYTDEYMMSSGIVAPCIDTGINNPFDAERLMDKAIHFHTSLYFDREGLTEDSVQNLQKLKDYISLHSVKSYYVSVIGHTAGYEDSNHMVQLNAWSTFWQNLGKKAVPESELAAQVNQRILAVYTYLNKEEDISTSRIFTENRLARDPIATEATKEGRTRNTRVDVALYY